MKLLARIRKAVRVLTGNTIVLTLQGNTLVVDAGDTPVPQIQSAAVLFFRESYSLS